MNPRCGDLVWCHPGTGVWRVPSLDGDRHTAFIFTVQPEGIAGLVLATATHRHTEFSPHGPVFVLVRGTLGWVFKYSVSVGAEEAPR